MVRPVALLVVLAFAAASCGSGRSVTEAGLDEPTPQPTTSTPAADDPPVTDESPPPAGTQASDDTAGASPDTAADASTTTLPPAPTTTIAELLPCPVDALDAAEGPVEISLWFGLAGDIPGVLQDVADEYNTSQDRVVVTIQNQVDYESVVDKFVQFGVDERPELILAPEYITQTFAQSELFVPLESCVDASGFSLESFLPNALSAYAFSGTQWGIPFNGSNPVLYYNRKMFEAAGLDPDDPPLSFDELRATSQQLVDSGAAAFGLVVDNARDSGSGGASFEQWFPRDAAAYADNGNGRLAPATEVYVNDDTGVEILTFLRDMVADGLAVSVGENAGGQAGLLKLADAEAPAAMVIETSAALGTVLAALGGGLIPGLGPEDVGVAAMPGPSDEPGAQIGGGALWIPAGKGDEVTAAAWDFVQFLLSPEIQSVWSDRTGYVPIRTDAVEVDPIASTFADDPRFRVAYDQLLAVGEDPLSTRPLLGPQREVRQELADAIAAAYADPAGADVRALLDQAAADANALITNYNSLN